LRKSPSSGTPQPELQQISYSAATKTITCRYDMPLAADFVPGPSGFAASVLGVPKSIDNVTIDEEGVAVRIQLDHAAPAPDHLTFSGIDPEIKPFTGGDPAASFDHPVPWN